jgi:hypothetical protein
MLSMYCVMLCVGVKGHIVAWCLVLPLHQTHHHPLPPPLLLADARPAITPARISGVSRAENVISSSRSVGTIKAVECAVRKSSRINYVSRVSRVSEWVIKFIKLSRVSRINTISGAGRVKNIIRIGKA